MSNEYHVPVLVEEMLFYLQPERDGIYIDGTLGGGSYTKQILNHISRQSKMICFDLDENALIYSQQQLAEFQHQLTFVHDNFSNIRKRLGELGVGSIQGLVLDLGVSSRQIDESARGFSFQGNDRVDMRMNNRQALDGWTVINTYGQEQLANLFWAYGEERNSRRIAKAIVYAREQQPIDTTQQLARVVESVSGNKFLQKSLSRIFQAVRIEVNKELENLEHVLENAVDLLAEEGRIVVVSYHSLEDRIVKQFFKKEAAVSIKAKSKLLPDEPHKPKLEILTKKPVEPRLSEVERNPRARSAKLRAAKRV